MSEHNLSDSDTRSSGRNSGSGVSGSGSDQDSDRQVRRGRGKDRQARPGTGNEGGDRQARPDKGNENGAHDRQERPDQGDNKENDPSAANAILEFLARKSESMFEKFASNFAMSMQEKFERLASKCKSKSKKKKSKPAAAFGRAKFSDAILSATLSLFLPLSQ